MSNVILDLFDLRHDQADPETIDETIRTNVKVVGTNLWVLIFAILIASVGLNVNSTAVVIGAMLISPLMGPIVGIGYGLGINDISLIKLALRNLLIFTGISLVTSSLYFTLSPLDIAQSELLARTSPNMWDVLIAFFGGAAGIIASTRKSMSNVVPGVAIATALMPPLCTAGFGIAHGNWTFFGGAFFLYSINSVFIAVATLMFAKIFHLPVRHYVDEKVEKRTHLVIGSIVTMMVAMSVYLSFNLVQKSRFTEVVKNFVNSSYKENDYVLLGHEVHPQLQEVILTVGGSHNPKTLKSDFEQYLTNQGFNNAHVTVRYSGTSSVDLGSLKTQLTQDLYNNMVQQVEELSKKNQQLHEQLNQSSELEEQDKKLFAELSAQYPLVSRLTISRGAQFTSKTGINVNTANDVNNESSTNVISSDSTQNNTKQNNSKTAKEKLPADTKESMLVLFMIESTEPLEESDKVRILEWLNVKFAGQMIEVRFEVLN